ncbi:hypothetical protein BaRGS_00000748, partial [Batillaria attramentaria]
NPCHDPARLAPATQGGRIELDWLTDCKPGADVINLLTDLDRLQDRHFSRFRKEGHMKIRNRGQSKWRGGGLAMLSGVM